jgi:hypothetical protein
MRRSWSAAAALTLTASILVGASPPADAESDAGATRPEEASLVGQSRRDDPEKADKWFFRQRAYPRKRIPPGAWSRAQRQAGALRRASIQTDAAPLVWSELGPRPLGSAILSWVYGGSVPYSGRITAIATHPTNPQIAYVGSANGGVWKTSNGGTNWAPVFDSAPANASPPIGAIAIDPNDPDRVVYVGTGEANRDTYAYFGSGLYRSSDGGGRWDKLGGNRFDQCTFSGIVVKRGSPTTIVVGVVPNGAKKYPTTCDDEGRGGIFRSINGGSDWQLVKSGTPTSIVAAPNNPSVLFAGLYGSGVYRSTDSGAFDTWKPVWTCPSCAGTVAVTAVPAGGLSPTQTVYAAFATPGGAIYNLYRSDNGGTNWTGPLAKPLGPSWAPTEFCGGNGQCNYDLAIVAAPSNPNTFFVGGVYLNRYSNNSPKLIGLNYPGETGCPYSGTSSNCIHVDFHALAFDASNRLWVGSDGGVYRTSDLTSTAPTFANLNSDLNVMQYNPGISGSVSGNLLLGGTRDNGTSRYTGGSSWSLVGDGDGGYSAVVANGSVVLTSTQYIWNSKSQRSNITKIVNGSRCSSWDGSGITEGGDYVTPMVRDPGSQSIVYAGTKRIYRTGNAGAGCGQTTWSPKSQYFSSFVSAIGPAPGDHTVYAGTKTGGLYVTRDARSLSDWTPTHANGLPGGRFITDIWVDPSNSAVAYVTVSGFDTVGPVFKHAFKTTNYGSSWQNISGNLPNSPANAVVVDRRTTPATIYVGMDAGVFWSNDGGTSWQNTSVGLPRTVVNDLLLDTTADRLIAATYGRGMWTAPPVSATPPGPPNDNFANAKSAVTLPFSDANVDTTRATTETNEPLDPTCTDFTGKTVWYRFVPGSDMTLTADTLNSNFDTVLVAYRGTSLGELTQVACNDDPSGQTEAPSVIPSFSVQGGQTYYFQAGGYRQTIGGTAASGTLNFHLAAGGPLNDQFAGATQVHTLPFSQTGLSTTEATTETNEPVDPTCTDFIGKTVWYKFVPGSDMNLTADTSGSTWDTVLVAYRGTSLTGLTQVACDDDGIAPSGASRITSFPVSAGQTYYFQAGGYAQTSSGTAASGTLNFHVDLAPPPNDAFSGATSISSLPFSETGLSTGKATTETNEPVDPTCTDFIGKTVWYKFVPGSDMNLTADTSGSTWDTVLVAYRGTSLTGLTQVACDDDGIAPSGASRITSFPVSAGQTYYFQVGGYRSSATATPSSGTLNFHLAAA